MKRHTALLSALAALLLAQPALAWGPIGHRTSAEIAENNISGHTRAKIAEILGHEGLPEASTAPDEERSNPDVFWQEVASPFHYVTLPPGQVAEDIVHPPEGDALTALDRFAATLRDDNASQEDKAVALRFIVHLVADLHQPLHAGSGTDRGGNDFIVSWFDTPTNLHWVWDEGMILRQQLSAAEYAERLEGRIGPAETIAWWDPRPESWITESAALRDRIYPATGGEAGMGTFEAPAVLQYRYHWEWMPVVEERLAMAGIRLAAYLDLVFAEEP
ncbi:S1/P1 nuclease [Alteraurantiacibacter aquimixticola]|uniref:S1/P1 Nuclease n=1 Tax=Alteraurantiacibacter aquimixticola TaxID=2489173 RepID=A0A4T3F5E9_9SPHN|nr:S1/P1 nuclease [Alteraurantiacibacter aquimixticola]TIX50728.1 S1/P1 Nuclease [Alteraurantiacibacter aquimixticola]